MARTFRIALAVVAALGPAAARPQWRTEPMPVRLEAAGLDVLAGAFVAAGEDDLLVVDQAARTARLRRHHALLSPQPAPFPIGSLPLARSLASGYLRQNGTDRLADVASHFATGAFPTPLSRLDVVFGSAPGTMDPYGLPSVTDQGGPFRPPYVVSFLRLLATTPESEQLVFPYCLEEVCSSVFLMDFGSAALPAATTRVLPAPKLEPMDTQPEAFPVWISTTARGGAVDDVAIGSFGTVLLYAHEALPSTGSPTLADAELGGPIVVGTAQHLGLPLPGWLPPTILRFGEVHGVASLDVDLDGEPDLVFAMSSPRYAAAGSLVWVKGTGIPADLANPLVSTWNDLGLLLQLPDPMTVRPLRVGGQPAVAIWDRALQELLVVTANRPEGRLDVWRAPAPGRFAKDIRLADLVGSPAQDLVVVMDEGIAPGVVLVYADLGFPAPELAWAAGSPGTPARGVPQAMGVLLDPGGSASVTVEVEWIEGAPTSAPVGTGLSHVFGPDCSMPPPPLAVLVRATDDTGQFDELAATLPLATLDPSVQLRGASTPGLLVLPPGGTTAIFDGVAATGCGATSFGGSWPAAATITDASGPTWIRRTVVLPEGAYPELLAEPELAVSLATTDPGAAQPVATLRLVLDGSGLVEVTQESDRAALADGELAVLRSRLRSRVSVALPGVRVRDSLQGLVAAGPPTVDGAIGWATPDGAEVLLDALPPGSTSVTISVPVRGTGRPGGSAVAARSSGGWPVTPTAQGEVATVKPPGCGCGAGSGPGGLALALLAAALRRRPARRRAT